MRSSNWPSKMQCQHCMSNVNLQCHRYETELQEATSCCVSWDSIELLDRMSIVGSVSLMSAITHRDVEHHYVEVGRLNGDIVAIKRLGHNHVNVADRQVAFFFFFICPLP